MTKLIVEGRPTGTGSVTLRPPVTVNVTEMELPTSGTHLSGANAEGMPQLADGTPVVESGSNTDGEWERYANDRQHCYIKDKGGSGAWTYPLPFVGIPIVNASAAGGNLPRFVSVSNTPTETACGIWSFTNTGTASGATQNATAAGYWR